MPKISRPKKIRLTKKELTLTWPKCNVSLTSILDQLKLAINSTGNYIKTYLICHELHKDGDDHRHAYLVLGQHPDYVDNGWLDVYGDDGRRFHGNYQDTKSEVLWGQYCVKNSDTGEPKIRDKDYITNLSPEKIKEYQSYVPKKKVDEAMVARQLMDGVSIKELLNNYPQLFFKLDKIKKNLRIYNNIAHPVPKLRDALDNVWLLGKTGTGKSKKAHEMYPDAFKKEKSEFWCAYEYQKDVMCEDMDESWPVQDFKIWTDWYSFPARIKHEGSIEIRPQRFVCTSQYTIAEWVNRWCIKMNQKPDNELVEALERRFTVIHIKGDESKFPPELPVDLFPDNYFHAPLSPIDFLFDCNEEITYDKNAFF